MTGARSIKMVETEASLKGFLLLLPSAVVLRYDTACW